MLEGFADGLTNQELGQMYFISPETVKSHVKKVLIKLEAKNRAHAVAMGFRNGWLK